MGRALVLGLRSYSRAATRPEGTVKSDAPASLLRLARFAKENPTAKITFNLNAIMLNPRMFEIAYHKLKSNPGMMTPGINPTTLDGFSHEAIMEIIQELRSGRFRFSPGRRVQIPKANGGLRPLTVAPPRDKIVQEVIRMILEAIFEPTFSDLSHGFRPGRSCHTALRSILTKFGVASWFIEGDISKCFDSFDHEILMKLIEDKIVDRRFTRLIRQALNAGYMEFREYKQSITGTPQGSIISPILCNIYLDKFDKFVKKLACEYNRGEAPRPNPVWARYASRKARAKSVVDKIKWHKLMLQTPSKDPLDPNFRRLVYVRYADDWIIGVRGPIQDCGMILAKIREFLAERLKLTLSPEKTLITNARHERALFLGVKICKKTHQTFTKIGSFKRRNGIDIRLEAPLDRIRRKLTEAGFVNGAGVPIPRFVWLPCTKDEIITLYNSVYNGLANYYSFAHNFNKVFPWVHYVLKFSCAKLLAAKYEHGSISVTFKKFGYNLAGSDKVSFVKPSFRVNAWNFKINQVDLIRTLFAKGLSAASLQNLSCSICGSEYRVEMHHVRALKDLNPKAYYADALMASRRRKQIPVCRECHLNIHRGVVQLPPRSTDTKK
jgi:group II intron reverse transcriptase/maturase